LNAGSRALAVIAAALTLTACGALPGRDRAAPQGTPSTAGAPASQPSGGMRLSNDTHAQDAVIYALGLIGNHYQFGGRNPDSGLDCSGMVSWIYEQVAGLRLPHNAARIASIARPIDRQSLAPGDLVFFNTNGKPHSHMGIYAGEGRFIHAPSTRGKYVRTDALDSGWFASRISGLRTLRRDV
jgi:cell wall-associated NlpC family hydrolase